MRRNILDSGGILMRLIRTCAACQSPRLIGVSPFDAMSHMGRNCKVRRRGETAPGCGPRGSPSTKAALDRRRSSWL